MHSEHGHCGSCVTACRARCRARRRYTEPVTAQPRTVALQARGLSCRRGGRLLFSQLDFTLHAGEVIWLRGDNGRGKTSLMRLLAGVVAAEEGTVRWFGHAARTAQAVPVQPTWVAHANALKDDLTVTESLAFLADLSMNGPAQPTLPAVSHALTLFGLERSAHALVRTLSQGQRRRVTLASLAMAPCTRTWLLDEPYDALDATNTGVLNELLRDHVVRGGSVVLTSHQALASDAPACTEVWLRAPARGGEAPAALNHASSAGTPSTGQPATLQGSP